MQIPQTLDTASYPAAERIFHGNPRTCSRQPGQCEALDWPSHPEGKARASQNATALGLFSASAFIRPDEQEAYAELRADWNARLVPDALVGELVQAAWRLRRCTLLETATHDDTTPAEDLDRMQASIDRARVAAQRALQRNITELRRLQTERRMRDLVPYGQQAQDEYGLEVSINPGTVDCASRRFVIVADHASSTAH